MSILSERFSEVKSSDFASNSEYPPHGKGKRKRAVEKNLLALQKESDKYTAALRSTKDPEAIELAERMGGCANGAWVYDHPRWGPHIRLGRPCCEPGCPICRDKRQRRAYSSSLPAFELLFSRDPLLKFCLVTLTAPALYGEFPAFKKRVSTFLKVMNFRDTVRGFHMTCGQEGPQAHCHILAFYHGDPPSEAECYAKWGGHVDVEPRDNSAETAASTYAYLYKGYQPAKREDVSKMPEASKLMKSNARVSKAGVAIKRAFRDVKSPVSTDYKGTTSSKNKSPLLKKTGAGEVKHLPGVAVTAEMEEKGFIRFSFPFRAIVKRERVIDSIPSVINDRKRLLIMEEESSFLPRIAVYSVLEAVRKHRCRKETSETLPPAESPMSAGFRRSQAFDRRWRGCTAKPGAGKFPSNWLDGSAISSH